MSNINQFLTELKQKYEQPNQAVDWFAEKHIKAVERIALELFNKFPEADRDAVLFSVWIHDIGRLQGIDDRHDEYGAQYAKEELKKRGFPQDFIQKVVHACDAHRCEEKKPETIEAKILASADAMSHFEGSFLLYVIEFKIMHHVPLDKTINKIKKKIKHDFNEKIQFDEARLMVKDKYEAWESILGS